MSCLSVCHQSALPSLCRSESIILDPFLRSSDSVYNAVIFQKSSQINRLIKLVFDSGERVRLVLLQVWSLDQRCLLWHDAQNPPASARFLFVDLLDRTELLPNGKSWLVPVLLDTHCDKDSLSNEFWFSSNVELQKEAPIDLLHSRVRRIQWMSRVPKQEPFANTGHGAFQVVRLVVDHSESAPDHSCCDTFLFAVEEDLGEIIFPLPYCWW